MDFSAALPTFVITLREGVEAALVVGIVLALLNKAKKSDLNTWVYSGVGFGIIVSVLIGFLFAGIIQAAEQINPQYASVVKPLMEGVFCLLAIIMLSWMLIWMSQQAKKMKAQVEGAVNTALEQNAYAGWGIFSLIAIAVIREGVETVLFIAANFQQGVVATIGAFAGLVGAVIVGALLFKWGIKINIRQFFQFMGVFLVLIVAGLVISALRKFDAAIATIALANNASQSLCFYYQESAPIHSCILGPMVWNTSDILPDNQFPGVILKALFGYRQNLYVVQAIGYLTFLLTVGSLYFRSITTTVSINSQKQASIQK